MEETDEIRTRIINGFAINRIPPKKKKWFIDFAEEEFCGDRGMALAHLVDSYIGILSTGVEHLEAAVESLQQQIDELKQEVKQTEEKKNEKTMMNGKVMKR